MAKSSFIERHLMGLCAVVISLGAIVFGIDTGIIATTISHDSFKTYMFGPTGTNNALLGAIVSTYSAGTCIGAFAISFVNDVFGRKKGMISALVVAVGGAAIQTGSNSPGMLIAGRIIAGLATGGLHSSVPAYISEISSAENRAFLVGLTGMSEAIGFCLANWIGYAGSFAKEGNAQWRIPLATQIPCAFALIFITMLVPESPRWLAQKDRLEESRNVIARLYPDRDDTFVETQLLQISQQIQLEVKANRTFNVLDLFTRRYLRRTVTAAFMTTITQLSGAAVIQNYQGMLYGGLGFSGKTILLISGFYGMMGIIGVGINLKFVADKWPRVRTMWVGSIVLVVMLSLLTALSKHYGSGTNLAGSSAGIAFIFLFSGLYALFYHTTNFIIASEILPTHLRSYGMGFAMACQGATSIWLGQVTPFAFEALQWKFYFIFIAALLVIAAIIFFGVPETNQIDLEKIGEKFGDEVVDVGKLKEQGEGDGQDEKSRVGHVEVA